MDDLLKWIIAPFRFLIWFFWDLLILEISYKLQERYPILTKIILIVIIALLIYVTYFHLL